MLEVSKSQNKAINIILQHKLPESKHRIEVKCTDESSGIFKVDKDRKKLTKYLTFIMVTIQITKNGTSSKFLFLFFNLQYEKRSIFSILNLTGLDFSQQSRYYFSFFIKFNIF